MTPEPSFSKYADLLPFPFWFFQRFPRINIGGDSTAFPSMEDAPLAQIEAFLCPHRRAGCDKRFAKEEDYFNKRGYLLKKQPNS